MIKTREYSSQDPDSISVQPNFDARRVFSLPLGVVIRPIAPTDKNIERRFIESLSSESNHYRFFGIVSRPGEKMLDQFTKINPEKENALIAVIDDHGVEKEIAVGRYIMLDDETLCEFALVVADEWQHKSIGRIIMGQLIEDARMRGFKKMTGTVLSQNRKMLSFVKSLGFEATRDRRSSETTTVTLPL